MVELLAWQPLHKVPPYGPPTPLRVPSLEPHKGAVIAHACHPST